MASIVCACSLSTFTVQSRLAVRSRLPSETRRGWSPVDRKTCSKKFVNSKLQPGLSLGIFEVRPKQTRRFPVAISNAAAAVAEDGVPAKVPNEDTHSGISSNATVVEVEDDMVMIQGVNPDVPVGSWVDFEGGCVGLVVWRREPVVFCCLTSSGGVPEAGESVHCRRPGDVAAVIPTQDMWGGDVVGPLSCLGVLPADKKEEEEKEAAPAAAAAGGGLCAVGVLGTPPDVQARTPIKSAMHTGLLAADAFIPTGRGQSMMVESIDSAALSAFGLNCILSQASSGVRAIYTSVGGGGGSPQDDDTISALQHPNNNNCVVAAPAGCSAVMRYLAACVACALAETVSYSGGDALLVLDDMSALADCWTQINSMWQRYTETQFHKSSAVASEMTQPEPEEEQAEEEQKKEEDGVEEEEGEDLVDFGGTLVPIEIAERRNFFNMFLQRAANLNENNGGGSVTIIGLCPGRPATSLSGGKGAQNMSGGKSLEELVAAYTTLSEEQREKMLAALKAKEAQEAGGGGEKEGQQLGQEGRIPTATIEEFNSISDGHMALLRNQQDKYRLSVRSSVSRIGSPAAAPAMRHLGTMDLRLRLMQCEDEAEFSANSSAELTQKIATQSAEVQALLEATADMNLPLPEQAVLLHALLHSDQFKGLDEHNSVQRIGDFLDLVRNEHSSILTAIDADSDFNELVESQLADMLSRDN